MPIALRLSLACLLIAAGGVAVLIYAHYASGWDAIAYFGWGLLITGSGLLGSLMLSGIAMIPESRWRRWALIEIGVVLVLLLGLAILWTRA